MGDLVSDRPVGRRRVTVAGRDGRPLNIAFRPAIPTLSRGCGATQATGLRHFRWLIAHEMV
jgi:hypothetical protein